MTQENAGIEIDFQVTPDDWLDVLQLMSMFHESNSQTRTELELEAIQYSILSDGFASESIIVNRWNGKIVAGHGKVMACHRAGFTGKLPVIYKNYESEAEHRLAMLRWNRARGHQDPTLESREVLALLGEFERDALASQLGYLETDFAALLNEVDEETTRASKERQKKETPQSEWPTLRVQVSPDTMALYRQLLEIAPGATDAEKLTAMIECADATAFPYLREDDSVFGDDN